MLDAGVGDGVEISTTFIEVRDSMIPPWAANQELLAMQCDRGTELSTALKDWGMDRANVAPAVATVAENMDCTGGMQALDGLARCTDGEQVAMDGDRTAEVGVRIEGRVLDRRIARPALSAQSGCMDDGRSDTEIMIMPRTDQEPLAVHGHSPA